MEDDDDTCCCAHSLDQHTPHLRRCKVEGCNCQRFHGPGAGHDEERRLYDELKDAEMHDTPNDYEVDSMEVQRTTTHNMTVADGHVIYTLFKAHPDVHTITLESNDSVITYTRDLPEDGE